MTRAPLSKYVATLRVKMITAAQATARGYSTFPLVQHGGRVAEPHGANASLIASNAVRENRSHL